MAWQDELVPMLRDMLGDNVASQKFTNAELQGVIVSAAKLVSNEVGFQEEYQISRLNLTITPDPMLDIDFSNLIAVRAACIITQGQLIKTAGQAIKIVDNRSQIDLKDTFRARLAITEGTWCEQYKVDLLNFKKRVFNGSGTGRQVISPYGRH